MFDDGELAGAMLTLGIVAVAILMPNICHLAKMAWDELAHK